MKIYSTTKQLSYVHNQRPELCTSKNKMLGTLLVERHKTEVFIQMNKQNKNDTSMNMNMN